MNKTITAEFDSIDIATIAARNVTQRVKGISEVKISYKNSYGEGAKEQLFSDFFIPQNFMSGVIVNESVNYPVNYNAVNEKRQRNDDITTKYVIVEIKTSNENARNIKSNLRAYGGLNIKER